MKKLKSCSEIDKKMANNKMGLYRNSKGVVTIFNIGSKSGYEIQTRAKRVFAEEVEKSRLEWMLDTFDWAWEEPMKEKHPSKSILKKAEKLQKLKMDTPQLIEVATEELKTKVYEKLNKLNFFWCNNHVYEPKDSRDEYPFYLCPLKGTWDTEVSDSDERNYTIISAEEWLKRFEEDQEEDKNQLLAAYPYPWVREEVEEVKEKKEVEKKKEVAGVDFVYGLDIGEAPVGSSCHGCCFWKRSSDGWCCDLIGIISCGAGDGKVYFLTKIPRKRPHVKGMAAIGAWLEEKGISASATGIPWVWDDGRISYNMEYIFINAGKPIVGDGFIPEEFADLIEYR